MEPDEAEFRRFMDQTEPRLRWALVAAYGPERGRDAAAEALGYAWEYWDEVRRMQNPIGYLYRVGQSRTRVKKTPVVFGQPEETELWVEPELPMALAALSERQRLAVVLVYGFGWSLRDVAELTGIAVTTVQNHLERGLARLRAVLGVHEDV